MHKLQRLKEIPSQTAGPFLHIGCIPSQIGLNTLGGIDLGSVLLSKKTKGKRITLTGKVFDGKNIPIRDGMVEIWQADANGLYQTSETKLDGSDLNFSGWGRSHCDFESGSWTFKTIKPGPVMMNNGKWMAPHISFWFVARGINLGLNTRMYFSDEHSLNEKDPLLQELKGTKRIRTLMARKIAENSYEFNIYLQGKNETIFFEI